MAKCQMASAEGISVAVEKEWTVLRSYWFSYGAIRWVKQATAGREAFLGSLRGRDLIGKSNQKWPLRHQPPLRSYFKDWLRATGWGARL